MKGTAEPAVKDPFFTQTSDRSRDDHAQIFYAVIPTRPDEEGPHMPGEVVRVIDAAWERSLACARDDRVRTAKGPPQ